MVTINLGFGRESNLAVVDVAPGGASVAYISSPKNGPARILATGASNLSLEPRTPEQAQSQIAGQVSEAAAQANKLYAAAGHKAPIAEVYIFLHAPWAQSHFLSGVKHFEHEVRIRDTHISELARDSLADDANLNKEKLLEASAFSISLNGYPVLEPEGSMASILEMSSLVSEGDQEVRHAVEGALHQAFPVAQLTWRSALRALATLARHSHIGNDLLLIDMGADDTHIASIQDNSLEQLVVPEGERTILARISGTRQPDEVLGFLRMLARDTCSSDACDAIRQALASAEPELVRVFGESIAKIATSRRVPNTLLLVAHPDLESWLGTFFSRIDFAQFTTTSLPLSVCTPSALDVGQWVEGAIIPDPITVCAALVNIEQRS